jgi:hypothetical protein
LRFIAIVADVGGNDLACACDDRERLPDGLDLHHLDAVVADIQSDRQNL